MAGEIRKDIRGRSSVLVSGIAILSAAAIGFALMATVLRHKTFVVWCKEFFLANLGDYGGLGLFSVGFAVILSAIVGAASCWFLARETFRAWVLRRHVRRLGTVRSGIVMRACAGSEMKGIVVVADADVYAFTSGLLFPKVRVSQGLVSLLSLAELRAVLRHEWYHARHRHPLQSLLAGMLSRVLFFIPSFRDIADHLASVREVCADRSAARSGDGHRALASALAKTMGTASPRIRYGEGVAHFSRLRTRVRALAAKDDSVELRLGIVRLLVSISIAVMIMVAATVAGGVADAHAGADGATLACPAPETVQDTCVEVSPFLKLDIEGPMSRALQTPFLSS